MPNRLMTNEELLLIGLLAGAILLGAVTLLITHGGDEPEPYPVAEVPQAVPAATPHAARPAPGNELEEIVVEVKGAVREPGVYEMRQGQRVNDLLETAGGVLSDADLGSINRAAHLVDATTPVVPRLNQATPNAPAPAESRGAPARSHEGYAVSAGYTTGAAAAGSGRRGLVNINTASQSELETLPRVGPVTAQKIIQFRQATPFRTVDDLIQIHGIGEKTLENLRPLITVR